MLSNVDIAKELNKNIWIYGLNTDNIKGASINLTASKWAWRVSDGGTAAVNDIITIPPHDSVLVETEEVIHVSDKIAGTYHSKVGLVSKGIGHIGTTLDPNWCGNSLIALHNTSGDPIDIKVGDTFVSLIFSYVKTEAKTDGLNGSNSSGRLDALTNINAQNIPEELKEDWRYNAAQIKVKCTENENETHVIQNFLNLLDPPQPPIKVPWTKRLKVFFKWTLPLLIAIAIYVIIYFIGNSTIKEYADKGAFPLLVGYFSVVINRFLK